MGQLERRSEQGKQQHAPLQRHVWRSPRMHEAVVVRKHRQRAHHEPYGALFDAHRPASVVSLVRGGQAGPEVGNGCSAAADLMPTSLRQRRYSV